MQWIWILCSLNAVDEAVTPTYWMEWKGLTWPMTGMGHFIPKVSPYHLHENGLSPIKIWLIFKNTLSFGTPKVITAIDIIIFPSRHLVLYAVDLVSKQ